jgi:arginine decarboxylase
MNMARYSSLHPPERLDRASLENILQVSGSESSSEWTIEASEELYKINSWGEPYFSINADGHLTVSPKGDRGAR